MNRIIIILLSALVSACENSETKKEESLPYVSYVSASEHREIISARYQHYEPPLVFESGVVAPTSKPANADEMLAYYAHALMQPDRSKVYELYHPDDPSSETWQTYFTRFPDATFSKVEVSSKLNWRKYSVYRVVMMVGGRKSKGYLFTYCEPAQCYISSPFGRWSPANQAIFHQALFPLGYYRSDVTAGKAEPAPGSFVYRFNPDQQTEQANKLQIVLELKPLNPAIIDLDAPQPQPNADPRIEAVLAFVRTVKSWPAAEIDKSNPSYHLNMQQLFASERNADNAAIDRYPFVAPVPGQAGGGASQCQWVSSVDFINGVRAWETLQPVAWFNEQGFSRVLVKSFNNGDRTGVYNFISLRPNSDGSYDLASGGSPPFPKLFCNSAFLPALEQYLNKMISGQ